jgi:hypothetical protein
VDLYGYERWSFAIKEETHLRVPWKRAGNNIWGEEVTGGRRRLHIEDIRNRFSPNSIGVRVRLDRVRSAHVESKVIHTKLQLKKLQGENHLWDLNLYENILINWILKEYDVAVSTRFNWLKQGPMMCSCEHNNEFSYFLRKWDYSLSKY